MLGMFNYNKIEKHLCEIFFGISGDGGDCSLKPYVGWLDWYLTLIYRLQLLFRVIVRN